MVSKGEGEDDDGVGLEEIVEVFTILVFNLLVDDNVFCIYYCFHKGPVSHRQKEINLNYLQEGPMIIFQSNSWM